MRKDRLSNTGRFLLGWGLIVAGVVLLAVGWYGVSGTPKVERQLSYLVSGGLGGLLAGIVGIGLLVANDVRRDRERLGRVEAAVLELRELVVAQSESLKQPEAAHGNGAATPKDRAVRTKRAAARKRA
jgi:hypothetical protein